MVSKVIQKIVLVGGGGHALVIANLIKRIGNINLLGYVDLVNRGSLNGVPYLGNDDVLPELLREQPDCAAAIGIGYVSINPLRRKIIDRIKSLGFSLPPLIAPSAILAEGVKLGEGVVILEGVIIGPNAYVGKAAIINTHVIVEHDVIIGSNVHLAPGSILCGGVQVGDSSIIGANSTVIQYKKICDNCLIAAGAVVTKDCLISGTYMGVPARCL